MELKAGLLEEAENGNPNSQYEIAMEHLKYSEASFDYSETIKWFELSAKNGNVAAKYQLGKLIFNGSGIEQSYSKSFSIFLDNANVGHMESQIEIAKMYFKGQGVIQDYISAYMWVLVAEAVADEEEWKRLSKFRLIIEEKMTKEQVYAAQEYAKKWKPMK